MLIPALDLINGAVVRLYQGDFSQKTEYQFSPVEQAQSYAKAGAKWLHLVDLDGAKDPKQRQTKLLEKLIKESGMSCQVGGGIRTTEDIDALLAVGVKRVVIGSTAVNSPEKVLEWFKTYGSEKIVLALDVNIQPNGQALVATHGWQESSGKALEDVLDQYLEVGCQHVLCTDISKDGTLSGSNVELYQKYKSKYPGVQWQASGGVSSLDDIKALKAINCDSVILGKSLLTNQFTLEDALACWQSE